MAFWDPGAPDADRPRGGRLHAQLISARPDRLRRRPPHPKWPGGARIAINFVMNYEEGSEPSVPDGEASRRPALTESGVTRPASTGRDLAGEGMFEYGSRVGFWRVMRLFQERGLPLTVFGCALALERNPPAAAAIRAAGFDVCSPRLALDQALRADRGGGARAHPPRRRVAGRRRASGRSAGTAATARASTPAAWWWRRAASSTTPTPTTTSCPTGSSRGPAAPRRALHASGPTTGSSPTAASSPPRTTSPTSRTVRHALCEGAPSRR